MSVEKEIRKILGEATPASSRVRQDLVRAGLGHDKNAAATLAALKDPEAAMQNPAKRELLLKVMQDLLDVVVNDPSMVMKTKTALRKEEVEESAEDIQEKLVGGQKKLDKNKNGKLDAEDFKKLRGESKKDKEDEDEKEMEDKEEDEVELSKDQVEKMIAAMKKAKGFKAHVKTLQGAEEGFVSHAQRKAVWASRNDAKDAMKRKVKKESIEQIDEVGDTSKGQKMLSKVHKRAVDRMIKAADKHDAKAAKKNQQTANRAWDRFDMKEDVEQVDEADNKIQYAIKHKMSKKILSTHKDLASAKDEWKGIDKDERPFYQVVSHSKPAKSFGTIESVTTDYNLVKGQSQNKTPTQKLATDYKLATKKRKEMEKSKQPIEPKDQMVGTAKVVKEAFPTVDDAKKRMKDALKSKFEKKKISTGTVYTRKYKEEPEDEKKSDK